MDKKALRSFIKHYGHIKQLEVAIEECSELIKAIVKYIRNDVHMSPENVSTGHIKAIIEEIADVEIMLEQLKIIFDCHEEVEEEITYKITRQVERMLNNQ